jgi:hypothetical protein
MDFENNTFKLTPDDPPLSGLPPEFSLDQARDLLPDLIERAHASHEEGVRLRVSGRQVDIARAPSAFTRSANLSIIAIEIGRRLEIEAGIKSFEELLREQ